MALGDTSIGTVSEVSSADTLEVDFTTGPRSGERWRVRDGGADAWEVQGPNRWLGQSAVEAVSAWLASGGGSVRVVETGQDQYGRLVGSVQTPMGPTTLTSVLIVGGWALAMTQTGSPPIVTLLRSDPRVGLGNPADLVVDTTLP
jgi:endonuclease YncB( thermonuclease family)